MFFVVSMDNTNANLFVSRDEMKKNLRSVLESDLEYKFKESTGCNSFAPQNWSRNSNYVYVDRLNPSFDIAFFRNEIPLVINNIKTYDDAAKLSQIVVDQVSKPIIHEDNTVHTGASIGIGIFPGIDR